MCRCLFEEGVAQLASGHRSAEAQSTGWGPWAGGSQPKLLEISGFYPHVVPVKEPPAVEQLEALIRKATFTGKSDLQSVVEMLKKYNELLTFGGQRGSSQARSIVKARGADSPKRKTRSLFRGKGFARRPESATGPNFEQQQNAPESWSSPADASHSQLSYKI